MNFREVVHRFGHLDAELKDFEYRASERIARYSILLYPYWEHPKLLEALRQGWRWNVSAPPEARRTVTVIAQGVHSLEFTDCPSTEEWAFYEEHPLIWDYEDTGQVVLNGPLNYSTCAQMVEAVAQELGWPTTEKDVWGVIQEENVRRFGESPPFSLGRLPRPVFSLLREELERRGVPFVAYGDPKPKQIPVVFVMDQGHVVADDFEVDVPVWEHRDEWVTTAPPAS